ncbi:MAG: sigma-70 family RNA polymerase sigma factor, partial [Planctomycetota bacterium]
MIAVAELTPKQRASRAQWADPRSRALLLARQLIASERRRVDRLVRDNLHLTKLAGSHGARLTGLDKDDLTAAAYFGLLRAAETFDPTKGAAFGTHAYWWQRATMQEEFYRMRSTIRVPRRSKHPIPKCSSLDVEGDDGSTIGAEIPDEQAEDPAVALHRADLRDALAAALGTIDPMDALVVEMRYGINGAPREHSFAEIAERLGVCPEWSRKIAERAREQL